MDSCYDVEGLAVAALDTAGRAVAGLVRRLSGAQPEATVDPLLAQAWFAGSFTPRGWEIPPPWDAIAGDYPCRDGWIRLHTNAPHHRAAALAVLGFAVGSVPDKPEVAAVVARWDGTGLENAVLAAGGCAAQLRTPQEWAAHPQGRAVAAEPLIAWTDHGATAATASAAGPERPLAGVRVLDLTRVIAGPAATRFLAGFGAEVLRIDPPGWEEPALIPEMTVGKRCARLDLKSDAGAQRIRELIADADILVCGYRPGALSGLGLDEPELRRLRPGLVRVELDAYGWTGPWAGRRGFDSLVQMSSGIADAGMRYFGADRPVPLPVQALDHATGYFAAAAAVAAWSDRLQGRVRSARLSLARTAAELRPEPGTAEQKTGAPDTGGHALPTVPEHTKWGPGTRLLPPLTFSGPEAAQPRMFWTVPAAPLGSAPPSWPGRQS